MTPEELRGATLTRHDFDGEVWIGAEIDELELDNSSLCRIRAAQGTWERCTFTDCDFTGADLAGLTTRDTGLVRCTLDGARLTGSSWLRSRLREVRATEVVADLLSAHSATWTDVTFTNANLRQADFTDARLQRVRFIDCDLSEARFAGMRAQQVTMTGCRLERISGVDALRGVTMTHGDAVSGLGSFAEHLGITLTEESR
ncbi:pentapeptide repeat-containing protein [Ruania halotolerans]|uniref:pentapeptide repeat-containing protein n=1 Tax=Ruania halotolerans TaxID=2897773 RepID=UPI001E3DBA9E|nr:pentapeptide repeat-containing protein [Ruania halotolerans]UFU07760.1 pentapeptide repeat-containing protein [Ruania halotolerans]